MGMYIAFFFLTALSCFQSNAASETRFHVIYTILYVFYDVKEYTCQNIYPNKLFVFPTFRSYFECFQKSGFYPKILSCVEMYLFKIRSEK